MLFHYGQGGSWYLACNLESRWCNQKVSFLASQIHFAIQSPYAWPKRHGRLHPVPEKIAPTFGQLNDLFPTAIPKLSFRYVLQSFTPAAFRDQQGGFFFPFPGQEPTTSHHGSEGWCKEHARNIFIPRWDMLKYDNICWFVSSLEGKGAVARHMSCDCCRKSPMSFWQPFDLQQQSCPGAPGEAKCRGQRC